MKEIKLCDKCNGTGLVKCSCCEGKGIYITHNFLHKDCPRMEWTTCPICDGKGTVECPICHGTGIKEFAS